uniref:Uncharacterized protein n=1 Tax=Seriola lalandi dorsalis TaxID=1841481 RepID=A0A3B4WHR8_SERLL
MHSATVKKSYTLLLLRAGCLQKSRKNPTGKTDWMWPGATATALRLDAASSEKRTPMLPGSDSGGNCKSNSPRRLEIPDFIHPCSEVLCIVQVFFFFFAQSLK